MTHRLDHQGRRGFSREEAERATSPRGRKLTRCPCGEPLAPDRFGTCPNHATLVQAEASGLEPDGSPADPFAGCICHQGAEDFPNGRSVCGVPCRIHHPRPTRTDAPDTLTHPPHRT